MEDSGADPALAKAEPVARLVPSGFDPGDGEMIERVARALFQAEWAHNGCEEEFASSREYWVEGARVAIEAMREPTNAMLQGACDSHKPGEPMSPPGATYKRGRYTFSLSDKECTRFRNRRRAWQQMIDTALAGIETGTAETENTGSVPKG